MSLTSAQQVGNGFGKRRDTTDITDFCPRQLITDLQRGNWCNGFWPLTQCNSFYAYFFTQSQTSQRRSRLIAVLYKQIETNSIFPQRRRRTRTIISAHFRVWVQPMIAVHAERCGSCGIAAAYVALRYGMVETGLKKPRLLEKHVFRFLRFLRFF